MIVLATGDATDATIRDYDTLSALLADADVTEATFTNYARKTLTDSDLGALPSPDDANDRYTVSLTAVAWAMAGGSVNNDVKRLFVCYSPASGSADSAIVPCLFYDFVITTDGRNIQTKISADGTFRAS